MKKQINKKPDLKPVTTSARELFAPCGMYCGLCTSYLSKKYTIPRRPGIISYCDGCRPRGKICSFVKKRCDILLNHEIDFCYECKKFPCAVLEKIQETYMSKSAYSYDFILSQKEIQKNGSDFVQKKLHKEHGCEKCGEILCIHNGLCYNCDKEQLAIMKNYRNMA
jgi:hypothetical protein